MFERIFVMIHRPKIVMILNTILVSMIFSDNPLPGYCDLEYQISERISQKLLQITNNEQLKMLSILNHCKIIIDGSDDNDHKDIATTHEYAAFVLTDSNLYVTKSKYGWLIEKLDRNIEVAQTQKMQDLVSVEHIDDTTFIITFLDEINSREEKWECKFETSSCLQNTFETLKTPWEKIFEVPLGN